MSSSTERARAMSGSGIPVLSASDCQSNAETTGAKYQFSHQLFIHQPIPSAFVPTFTFTAVPIRFILLILTSIPHSMVCHTMVFLITIIALPYVIRTIRHVVVHLLISMVHYNIVCCVVIVTFNIALHWLSYMTHHITVRVMGPMSLKQEVLVMLHTSITHHVETNVRLADWRER